MCALDAQRWVPGEGPARNHNRYWYFRVLLLADSTNAALKKRGDLGMSRPQLYPYTSLIV